MSLKFSSDHEWVDASNPEAAIVGITVHAQDALGDVVFVELPEVGASFSQGDIVGVVESVKAAADVFLPVDGEIVEVNETLRENPGLANTAPMGQGWFFKVRLTKPQQLDGLLDQTAYEQFASEQ